MPNRCATRPSICPLARAAEAGGYHSFIVPDNLGFPGQSDARYPYTVEGDNAFLEDKPFLEPFTVDSGDGGRDRNDCASRPSS